MAPGADSLRRRFARREEGRVVAGVCTGIGRELGLDRTVVRLAFGVATLAGGAGIVLYLVLWVGLPDEEGRSAALPTWRAVQEAIGVGLLVLAALLALRTVGVSIPEAVLWPAALIGAGLALNWTRGRSPSAEERGIAFRIVFGSALILAGVIVLVGTSDGIAVAWEALVAALTVAVGLLLIVGPWLLRLWRELARERAERIRSEERADLAARIHDSVLQTLALVQRHADDPRQVTSLARRQERDLRGWLYGTPMDRGASLVSRVEAAGLEVEDREGVRVEVAHAGDCPVDERLDALVLAAREAMTNAARFSGQPSVDVFVEVDPSAVAVFVRDRGPGFDPASVAGDRRGIADSIIGRMDRAGGRARIHTAPGEGTEVELGMPSPPAGSGADR